jgi:hypothetical protein
MGGLFSERQRGRGSGGGEMGMSEVRGSG